MGRIRRGTELARSAWRVLKLDKELVAMPIFSGVVSVVIIGLLGGLLYINSSFSYESISGEAQFSSELGNWGWFIVFMLYLATIFVANWFGAALIYGAMQRFQGQNPTVRSSLSAAKRRTGSIALFSLLTAVIGYVLQAIEEHVPFAGKVTTWILQATWSIASMFAIPVIVMNDEPTNPLDATKKSAQIVKKVWGESVVAQIGVGIIQLFYVLGWGLLMLALTSASLMILQPDFSSQSAMVFGGVMFSLLIGGFIAIGIVFSALAAIAKAAVYHYATTGESPELFNKQLLQQAMTPKKAQKIFG